MSIIRVKKDANYVVMHKHALQNDQLSWKAKGLLAHMLSMPDDWAFYREELATRSTDGVDAVRSGLQELEKHGYLIRQKQQADNGRFDWETTVYETPQDIEDPAAEKPAVEKPAVENPPADNPPVENPALLNNNPPSNNALSNNAPIYVEIVDYLNEKAGKQYKPTTRKTKRLIDARLNEGFETADFKSVIDKKTAEWDGGDMEKYLRPETLFGTKFEGYLNQEVPTKRDYIPGQSYNPAVDRF